MSDILGVAFLCLIVTCPLWMLLLLKLLSRKVK